MTEIKIDRAEILRYLGCRGKIEDERLLALVSSCVEELKGAATPRIVSRLFPVSFPEEGVCVGNLLIPGKSLRGHLHGCGEAVLFAATLGTRVDALLMRYGRLDISRAAVLQAASAAMIEGFCDGEEKKLAARAAGRGLFLRPRYSPGYGDFPLSLQRRILAMLDAQKRIGLTLTEGCLLVPTKSVTAVVGLTRDSTSCHLAKCMECSKKNCPFRKE